MTAVLSARSGDGHQELAFILLVRALVVLFALLLLTELDRHLDLQLLARPAVVGILTAMTGATHFCARGSIQFYDWVDWDSARRVAAVSFRVWPVAGCTA